MKTLVLILVLSFSILGQTYRYVDPEATGANTGLTPEDAWNGFDDFNINNHSEVPPGTTILVAAGTYTAGHSSYGDDGIIIIQNNYNITIKPGDPQFEEGDPLVVFSGSSSKQYGIVVQPEDCDAVVHHISIQGIKFENFTRNPIKLRGYRETLPWDNTCTNYLEYAEVRFCHFSDIIGAFTCDISCAAIHVQITKNVTIELCRIEHTSNVQAQTDGIYFDNSENVEIRDNYIKIQNNATPPAGCQDNFYHIDCIQFADQPLWHCKNVIIERNQLIQNGNNDNHSGIIMSGVYGVIKIYNNNIVATKSQNLLNLRFYEYTNYLWIFNNTLVGLENNIKLVGIVEESGDISEILKIRNNIFYKEGGTNPVGLTFFLQDGSNLSNEILDYNLYYISGSIEMLTEISIDGVSKSNTWDWGPWEVNGTDDDPNFEITNGLYKLSINSKAKNRGQRLQDYDLVDDFFQIKRPYWVNGVDLGAFEIPEAQLRIGVTGLTSPDEIYHNIESIATLWEKNGNQWPVSTDPSIAANYYRTIGNSNTDKEEWNGFHLKWMRPNVNEKSIGHAFYKLTNNHSDAFIYIDLRDVVTNYNPNIYIRYQSIPTPRYSYWNIITKQFEPIDNGTILRVWQIKNGTPNTANLDNFWINCLVQIEEENHPKFVWGPYPGISIYDYRLYRSGSYLVGNRPDPPYPTLITVNGVLDYRDNSVTIGGNLYMRSYYLSGLTDQDGETEPTNIVDVYLLRQYKLADNNYNIEYELKQNYPNPFNPSTTISFSIPQDTKVNLVIYDILGREVETLVNDNLAAGIYETRFNAEDLSSGIYFYRLSAGKYSETKKLQLIK